MSATSPTGTTTKTIGPLAAIRMFVFNLAPVRPSYATTHGRDRAIAADDFCVLRSGTVNLIVEAVNSNEAVERAWSGFFGISFTVPDIAEAYDRLCALGLVSAQAGALGSAPAHFKDPAGNVLRLIEGLR